MMRRLFVMLVALVMVIGLIPVTALAADCSCGHSHDGSCGYRAASGCACEGNGAPYHAFNGGECTYDAGSACTHTCPPAEPEKDPEPSEKDPEPSEEEKCEHKETYAPFGNGVLYCKKCHTLVGKAPEQPEPEPEEKPEEECKHPNATYVEAWGKWHCGDCSSWFEGAAPEEKPEEKPEEEECKHPNATYVEAWGKWHCGDCSSWFEGAAPEGKPEEKPEEECKHPNATYVESWGMWHCGDCFSWFEGAAPEEKPEEQPEEEECKHPNATYVEAWGMWHCGDCSSWFEGAAPEEKPEEKPEEEECKHPNATYVEAWGKWHCGDCFSWFEGTEPEEPECEHDFSWKLVATTTLASPATYDSPALYYYSCRECGALGSKTFPIGKPLEKPAEPEEECKHPNATYVESWGMWHCGDCFSWFEGTEPEEPECEHDFSWKLVATTTLASPATYDSPALYYYSCRECGALGSKTFPIGKPLEKPAEPEEEVCKHPNATYVKLWNMWYCDDCHSWYQGEEEAPEKPEKPDKPDKPQKPEKPEKPDKEKPSKPHKPNKPNWFRPSSDDSELDDVPKTGDSSGIFLLSTVAMLSAAGLAALLLSRKHRFMK